MFPPGLIPTEIEYRAFIAGGWAACPALATDMDVWVMADTTDVDAYRQMLLDHLRAERRYSFLEQEPGEETIKYEGVTCTIRKVAIVYAGGRPVHLMVTDGTLLAVLENFDISTHQIAITWNGEVVPGPDWTPITEPPRVLQNVNDKTQARLEKICQRYHLTPFQQETTCQ